MVLTLRDAAKKSRSNSQATEREQEDVGDHFHRYEFLHLCLQGRRGDKQIVAEAGVRAISVLYEQLPGIDIIKSGQVCFALCNRDAIGWGDGVLREYLVAEEPLASPVPVALRSSPSVGGTRTNRLGLGSSLLCLLIIWISFLPGVLRRVHDLWA